ncbi:hypothetical protein [Cohnella candidum]|uniref:Uncharacterized protein n=1 Tax=Cohnella candidum TaxID=2674991 RepID=A0A3G3K4C7_9BACL|nr:hypothetical protein [Cohnella candidum]AYQ75250.1 hypothetical protein EAV92_23515 [Cohnella candidum]
MRNVTPIQHEERVEAVLNIIHEIFRPEDIADERIESHIREMSYEDLGMLVLELVKTRSLDRFDRRSAPDH